MTGFEVTLHIDRAFQYAVIKHGWSSVTVPAERLGQFLIGLSETKDRVGELRRWFVTLCPAARSAA